MFNSSDPECQDLFSKYICTSLLFRSRNSTANNNATNSNTEGQLELVGPLCSEECLFIQKQCPTLWSVFAETELGRFISCDNTGYLLEPLVYCCTSEGIEPPPDPEKEPPPDGKESEDTINGISGRQSSNTVIGITLAVILLLLIAAALGIVPFLIAWKRLQKFKQISFR